MSLFEQIMVMSLFEQTMVMILSFRISRSWQTVYTQIRLVLQDLSDDGLPFLLQHMEVFLYCKATFVQILG